MQEIKDNQPDSFGDARATRRKMETWQRGGRIEMEKRERHIRDEFKDVQYQFEVLASKIEDVAAVADRVEEMPGQMDQLQRIIQQVIDNSKPAASNVDGLGRSARERQISRET